MSYLAIQNLSVVFPRFELRSISLSLEQGQTLVLLGPSGSGKSVLLETVAGFHPPASGRIELCGRNISSLPPEERGLGFMFQDYSLFPHLTVEKNIAFGLRRKPEADRRVEQVLELLGVRHLTGRRPSGLSGGEKQRVALARALATEPRLFLFDEPLSALDARMREELREDLRRLLRSLKATSVYVTHDRLEARTLADVIAIIQDGVIRQVGQPHHVFTNPVDAWVAKFVGMQVLRPEQVEPVEPGRVRARVGDAILDATVSEHVTPETARLVFRPEDVHLEHLNGQMRHSGDGFAALVESVVPLGSLFRIELNAGPHFSALVWHADYDQLQFKPGDKVLARLDPADLLLVPEHRKL